MLVIISAREASSVSLAKAEYEVNNGEGNEYILKQAIEKLPVDFSAIIIDLIVELHVQSLWCKLT